LPNDTVAADFDVTLGAGSTATCQLMQSEEVEWDKGEELVSALRCSTFGGRSTIVHDGNVMMPKFAPDQGLQQIKLVDECADKVHCDMDGFVPYVGSDKARMLREESRVDACDWLNLATEPEDQWQAMAALRSNVPAQQTEEHLRTHMPFDPNCEICQLARETRGAKITDSSTALHLLDDVEVAMSFDLKTGFSTGHDGETVLGVARVLSTVRIGSDEDMPLCEFDDLVLLPTPNVYYSEPMISKDAGACIDAIHNARKHFRCERRPTVLLTDRERGIVSKAFEGYARDTQLRFHLGVPNESNTTAAAEAAVRFGWEGGMALLLASGEPEEFWPDAMRTWAIQHGVVHGHEPRVNTVPKTLVFGQYGVLAVKLVDPFNAALPRSTPVIFNGYDDDSSGGVVVLYRSGGGMKRMVVLAKNVTWARPMAFGFTRRQQDMETVRRLLDVFSTAPVDDGTDPVSSAWQHDAPLPQSADLASQVTRRARILEAYGDVAASTRTLGGVLFDVPVQESAAPAWAIELYEANVDEPMD